ncbi:MAG: DUF1501 domain-containing protein [bacterium]
MVYLSRRQVIAGMVATSSLLPSMGFAKIAGPKRFVVIILRGAMDGLAAVPVLGDPHYSRLRGELALSKSDCLTLNGDYSLHPALKNLHCLYTQNEALILHAIASPYRERSHFDGQDVLEHGGERPLSLKTGWMNRALTHLHGAEGLAIGQNLPLILRGPAQASSWAPSRLPDVDESTVSRLQRVYKNDPLLSLSLQQAIDIDDKLGEAASGKRLRGGKKAYIDGAEQAAQLLARQDGASIAVLQITGWDTHARQGTLKGNLPSQLTILDSVIEKLRTGLASVWQDTAILTITEFGRTVRVNGTGGTDHGTGSAAFLFGGAVQGGRVQTDWPGLSESKLYENRDLRPTADLRSLYKSILHDHLQISQHALETDIFPDSGQASIFKDIII